MPFVFSTARRCSLWREVLQTGRILMSDAEHEALDALIAAKPNAPMTVTRRDPGESGPLIVADGDENTYVIQADGKIEESNG